MGRLSLGESEDDMGIEVLISSEMKSSTSPGSLSANVGNLVKFGARTIESSSYRVVRLHLYLHFRHGGVVRLGRFESGGWIGMTRFLITAKFWQRLSDQTTMS